MINALPLESREEFNPDMPKCWTGYAPTGSIKMAEAVRLTYRRSSQPKGPLAVFGYDYFQVEWTKQAHTVKPGLLEYEGLWGGGEEYAYEVLNFADGNAVRRRSETRFRRSMGRCHWKRSWSI